jgi:hypothetical protein
MLAIKNMEADDADSTQRMWIDLVANPKAKQTADERPSSYSLFPMHWDIRFH